MREAHDTDGTMIEVKLAMRQMADTVGEIAAACDEQSRGIDQANHAQDLTNAVAVFNLADLDPRCA